MLAWLHLSVAFVPCRALSKTLHLAQDMSSSCACKQHQRCPSATHDRAASVIYQSVLQRHQCIRARCGLMGSVTKCTAWGLDALSELRLVLL